MNPTDRPSKPTPSCCPGGNCGGIQRRDFIKTLALGPRPRPPRPCRSWPGPSRPPSRSNSSRPTRSSIPQWVKSLFDRGAPRGLSRQGTGEDRHAHRRAVRGPTLPGRRRQALALGHLQQGHGHRRPQLCPSAAARLAAGTGLRRGDRGRRPEAGAGARSHGLLRHHLLRRVSHRLRRVSRSAVAGQPCRWRPSRRTFRWIRRLQPARHGDALHGQEYQQRQGRGPTGRLAGERRRAVHGARRRGPAAEHGRAEAGLAADRKRHWPRTGGQVARGPTSSSRIFRRRPTKAGRSPATPSARDRS